MKIFSIRSGSRGNAALVLSEKNKILIDCGISGKATEAALAEVGVNPSEIDGIIITHEHSDHIAGVGIVMRRYNIPVWANAETWQAMSGQIGRYNDALVKIFENEKEFEIGNVGIKPFSIPHDAACPVGYSLKDGKEKISVATDIGELKKDLFSAIRGSSTVLLEANHDVNMLEIGNYPLPLKRRIRGKLGHLSNDDAAMAAEFLVKLGTEKILLGHLSEENNYPELAMQTVLCGLDSAGIKVGEDVLLDVASREKVVTI